MGIESRHKSGKLYYYRKRREGGRVVSEYMGNEGFAPIFERQMERERLERKWERERLDRKLRAISELEDEIDRVCELVEQVASAHLIASGYHRHNRQWRKRRNGSSKKSD
jgi:hypothetical protein